MANSPAAGRNKDLADGYDEVFRDYAKLQRTYGSKDIRLKVRTGGGDTSGKYDPASKTITVSKDRLREDVKRTGGSETGAAKKVVRHELAHSLAEKRKPGSTLDPNDTHGPTFERFNRMISGGRRSR